MRELSAFCARVRQKRRPIHGLPLSQNWFKRLNNQIKTISPRQVHTRQSCFVGISRLFKTSWFFVCPSTVWPKAALIRPFDGWSALIERMCCQNDAKSGSWEGNTDRWWRTQNQALPFQNPEKVVLVGWCPSRVSHVCAMANWWLYPHHSLSYACMHVVDKAGGTKF